MKKQFLVLFIAAFVFTATLAGSQGRDGLRTLRLGPGTASAQQFSAPINLRVFVLAPNALRFQWDRGQDNEWFCIDTAFTADDLINFRGSWANWGCGTTVPQIDAFGIRCGTLHWARVFAKGPGGAGGHSAPVSFISGDCGFSPPGNPRAQAFAGFDRFQWDRGADNQFYCVDTAFTFEDLIALRGSWSNWGCGTTATTLDLTALQCGTLHHWRVWAQGTNQSGHSPAASFTTHACAFSPPTNLRSQPLAGPVEGGVVRRAGIRFQWDPGMDNQWFCVDTALSSQDLNFFTGTWRNHGCGTTATTLDVTDLQCSTLYHWRVYARGTSVGGHSVEAQAISGGCVGPVNP